MAVAVNKTNVDQPIGYNSRIYRAIDGDNVMIINSVLTENFRYSIN